MLLCSQFTTSVPVYVAILEEKIKVHIFGHLQKKQRHIFVLPHKSYFVCSPEMEDIAEKQPISAYKVAESMFFEPRFFCPAAAVKQFRQAEALHTEEL